jgi:hypothetical protein
LARHCQTDVFRDLKSRVASNANDAGQCALQLAALAINGYLITDSIEETVEKYLTFALEAGNELALSGAFNVFNAMGRRVPDEARRRILQRFEDPVFREHAVVETKALFFPLSFDPTIKPKPTKSMMFKFVHRRDINEKAVGVGVWARECKRGFVEYVRSREN